jgi:hypothetical protein
VACLCANRVWSCAGSYLGESRLSAASMDRHSRKFRGRVVEAEKDVCQSNERGGGAFH